jgi:hypothetical protein
VAEAAAEFDASAVVSDEKAENSVVKLSESRDTFIAAPSSSKNAVLKTAVSHTV